MRVLVFTMEKVGSSTLMHTLGSAGHIPGRAYARNMADIDWSSYDRMIAAVRDPIARNISWYYEMGGTEPIENDWPLKWCDDYLEPKTGINVYDTRFPTVKGWKIYQGYLLVIKTELMSKALGNALTMLCGEGDYKVEHIADGEFKFGPEYKAVVGNAKFDKKSLDRMYKSKYMRHFYSPKQIEALKKKWTS